MIKFFNALQLVLKRTGAHWKLLSSIVVGVVVAVAILASTPLYSNALNDLGLRHTFDKQPAPLLDFDVYSSNNPIEQEEFDSTSAFIKQQVNAYVGNLVRQEESFILSEDFNAMVAGNVIPVATDSSSAIPTGYFQDYTNLEKHVRLVAGRYPKYTGKVPSTGQLLTQQGTSTPTGTLMPDDLSYPDTEIEGLISPRTAETHRANLMNKLGLHNQTELVRFALRHGIVPPQ